MNNILQPISPDFNIYARENASVYFNSSTPAAPSGNSNITFQFDQFGNVSAYFAAGGGGNIPSVTNLLSGNGSGSAADSGIAPANVALLSAANAFTGANTFSALQTFNGNVTISPTNSLSFGASSLASLEVLKPGYNLLTFNGVVGAGSLGIYGAIPSTTDFNLYLSVPTSGTFEFRVNNVNAAVLSSTLLSAPSLALTASTVATSATAGAATVLPVAPLGYVEMSITISGTPTTVKLPYYSV
jgi:hypothetical protein